MNSERVDCWFSSGDDEKESYKKTSTTFALLKWGCLWLLVSWNRWGSIGLDSSIGFDERVDFDKTT